MTKKRWAIVWFVFMIGWGYVAASISPGFLLICLLGAFGLMGVMDMPDE